MLEVHIAQQPGETMTELRQRVRTFCESNRVPFEQAGQVPQALAIFVADEATRTTVEQGLAGPAPAVAAKPAAAEAPPAPSAAEQPPEDSEPRSSGRRETLRPSRG